MGKICCSVGCFTVEDGRHMFVVGDGSTCGQEFKFRVSHYLNVQSTPENNFAYHLYIVFVMYKNIYIYTYNTYVPFVLIIQYNSDMFPFSMQAPGL